MRSAPVEFAGQAARFVGEAVVGEVAADHQHIGFRRDLREQGLERPLRRLAEMKVAHTGDADG